ncbi:hypothetical protein BV25DRAFT_756273 [Artomyces pyxidatus]|uniref:Uncharacterized protein n=1 Tax=Artomyces pyxidatus TaxID=48021 RepID=A0ACB8SZZ2_9AGAM|nr:hypothetical protein BV25DRAFT_756273 [Artomyces pyxidatus]
MRGALSTAITISSMFRLSFGVLGGLLSNLTHPRRSIPGHWMNSSSVVNIRTHTIRERLKDFFIQFGPSPRLAYTHATESGIEAFRSDLQRRLLSLSVQSLKDKIPSILSSEGLPDDGLSNKLFVALPTSVRLFSAPVIPPRTLQEMLRDAIAREHPDPDAVLCELFLARPLVCEMIGSELERQRIRQVRDFVRQLATLEGGDDSCRQSCYSWYTI